MGFAKEDTPKLQKTDLITFTRLYTGAKLHLQVQFRTTWQTYKQDDD